MSESEYTQEEVMRAVTEAYEFDATDQVKITNRLANAQHRLAIAQEQSVITLARQIEVLQEEMETHKQIAFEVVKRQWSSILPLLDTVRHGQESYYETVCRLIKESS